MIGGVLRALVVAGAVACGAPVVFGAEWSAIPLDESWFVLGGGSGFASRPKALHMYLDAERECQRGYWEGRSGAMIIGVCESQNGHYFTRAILDVAAVLPTVSESLKTNASSIAWADQRRLTTAVGPGARRAFTVATEREEWCDGFAAAWKPVESGHLWQIAGYMCTGDSSVRIEREVDAVLTNLGIAGQFDRLVGPN